MNDLQPLDRRGFLSLCIGSAALASTGFSKAKGWDEVRKQFPLDPVLIYMNNGGLGPSPHAVIETITREMMALERISETGHAKVEAVREKACRFFNCSEEELAFTRSTTEGMNIIARGLPLEKGDEVMLSTHEHPGGSMCWLALMKDKGINVKLFEPDDPIGRIAAGMTPRTRVVSISHVTCTTGLKVPAREIASLCREKGVFSVFDGAQSAGMFPIDLHDMGCDFYATSGHKWLLGPKGTGILYINKRNLDTWKPTYVGAYSDKAFDLDGLALELLKQAPATEYGTRNTPLILGLGAAFDYLTSLGMERVAARGRELAARLKKGLARNPSIETLTPMTEQGSMVTFRPKGKKADPWQWVNRLKKEHRIRVRPVGEHGLNAIRVSTHIYNTKDEVDRLLAALDGMA
jgi:selenocysteine lyase/cysteine desulfurase